MVMMMVMVMVMMMMTTTTMMTMTMTMTMMTPMYWIAKTPSIINQQGVQTLLTCAPEIRKGPAFARGFSPPGSKHSEHDFRVSKKCAPVPSAFLPSGVPSSSSCLPASFGSLNNSIEILN